MRILYVFNFFFFLIFVGILCFLFYFFVSDFQKDSVIVAIIDSGIDDHHEDLKKNIIHGYDFVDFDPFPKDESGHGTHIAGIVSSLSPESKLLAIRSINKDDPYVPFVGLSIFYAVMKGADVINLSLSEAWNPLTKFAVYLAEKKGVIMVSSAGNEGKKQIGYPAAYKEVISVGSFNPKTELFYSFSNYSEQMDFYAPGVIKSTYLNNEQRTLSGTSMSSAYVSGILAFLLEKDSSLSKNDLINKLSSSSNFFTNNQNNLTALVPDIKKANSLISKTPYFFTSQPLYDIEKKQYYLNIRTEKIEELSVFFNFVQQPIGTKKDKKVVYFPHKPGNNKIAVIAKKDGKMYTSHYNLYIDEGRFTR